MGHIKNSWLSSRSDGKYLVLLRFFFFLDVVNVSSSFLSLNCRETRLKYSHCQLHSVAKAFSVIFNTLTLPIWLLAATPKGNGVQ